MHIDMANCILRRNLERKYVFSDISYISMIQRRQGSSQGRCNGAKELVLRVSYELIVGHEVGTGGDEFALERAGAVLEVA